MSDNVCDHKQLARSCELCEKDREIERLREEVAKLDGLLSVANKLVEGKKQLIAALERELESARRDGERLSILHDMMMQAPVEAWKMIGLNPDVGLREAIDAIRRTR